MRKVSDSGVFNCIICKEDRDYTSVGICDHKGVCIYCSLRSRILYKDKKCPICTTKLDYVFIIEVDDKSPIVELENNKEYFYKDDDFDENGVYFATVSAKEEALTLKSFICPIRACQEAAFDNLQTLSTHLNKVHKRYYWYLIYLFKIS